MLLIKPEDFGKIVREKRKARNISQEALARASGVHRMTILRVENGQHYPELPAILRIASALGLVVDLAPSPRVELDLDALVRGTTTNRDDG